MPESPEIEWNRQVPVHHRQPREVRLRISDRWKDTLKDHHSEELLPSQSPVFSRTDQRRWQGPFLHSQQQGWNYSFRGWPRDHHHLHAFDRWPVHLHPVQHQCLGRKRAQALMPRPGRRGGSLILQQVDSFRRSLASVDYKPPAEHHQRQRPANHFPVLLRQIERVLLLEA